MGDAMMRVVALLISSASCSHRLRRRHDRFDDLFVACAAANISVHEMLELRFAWIRVFIQERLRGQNHARRTEPTLKSAMFDEGLLQRMQFAVLRQALDGQN